MLGKEKFLKSSTRWKRSRRKGNWNGLKQLNNNPGSRSLWEEYNLEIVCMNDLPVRILYADKLSIKCEFSQNPFSDMPHLKKKKKKTTTKKKIFTFKAFCSGTILDDVLYYKE